MAKDMLKTGMTWLTGQLKNNASQEITYRRDTDEVTLRATPGAKLLKLMDADGGVIMEWTDIDFLIPAADLVLNDETIEPERGDQVDIVIGSSLYTFEVRPVGSEPAWRYCDPYHTMIRVHAYFIDSEPYA